MGQEMPAAFTAWKMEETDSPLKPLEGTTLADVLIFAPSDSYQTCEPQNCWRISVCCFKPLKLVGICQSSHREQIRATFQLCLFKW